MLRTELIRPLPETLIEHAIRLPGKTAFADGKRKVSYLQLEGRTRYIAGNLAALGVYPGDRAAIYLGNCVEVVESYLAITRAEAIGVPLNPHSTDAELDFFLADSGAHVVITDTAHADQVKRILRPGRRSHVIVAGAEAAPAGTVSFEALATTEPAVTARDGLDLDDAAWMLYTSGTTGKPKGVLSSQRSCLWSVAACYVPVPGLCADDRVLWPLPLFHSLSHIACVLAVTSVGAYARIIDGYSADEILSVFEEESPTFLAGVPAMYHQLVLAARRRGARARGLRVGLVGGSITTQALRQSFEETFGVPLLDAYGSTETCGSITINWPDGERVEGSCGLPVPGLNVRLVNSETGEDVPVGAEGEVWVSGPNVMAGYHNRPEETALALRGGWFHTGDLARRDEAGYFTISGRIKDLIIRGGVNIHPGEIEDVLRVVPGVADVAVAGKPHDILGEVPVAFLVPGPEGLDADALFAACRERLSYFKVPEALYEVERIPRTRSGKVTRRVLLEQPARLRAAGGSYYESLFRVDWVPLPPLDWSVSRADAPDLDDAWPADLTVLTARSMLDDSDDPARLVSSVGSAVRSWFAAQRRSHPARLVVLTHHGISLQPSEQADVRHAAVAGLAHDLQAELGDRLVHIDVEDEDAPDRSLLSLALSSGEPRLAIRAGSIMKPALARLPVSQQAGLVFNLSRTVVIAGADTPAGTAIARHLVAGHGIRKILLLGDGESGDLALTELAAELTSRHARVSVATCDLAVPEEIGRALTGVSGHLSGVVHAQSGPFENAAVAASVLDMVTREDSGIPFVTLCSAANAGIADEPGDAAIAAFCDALAWRRRGQGSPALSLSLGPWDGEAITPDRAQSQPAGVGRLSCHDVLAMYYICCFPLCECAAAQRGAWVTRSGYMPSPPFGRRSSPGEGGEAGAVVGPACAGLVAAAPV